MAEWLSIDLQINYVGLHPPTSLITNNARVVVASEEGGGLSVFISVRPTFQIVECVAW